MRTYEVWTLTEGDRPALLDVVPHIARAAALKVDWMKGRNPETACAWVQCPERCTQDNPEGIWESDLRVIRAAEHLAYKSAREQMALGRARLVEKVRNAREAANRPVLAVACKARDLTETLSMSIAVVEGRADLARRFARKDLVERIHQQLTWMVRFPNIVRAAR